MAKLDFRELAQELMQAHASAGTVERPTARDEDFSMQDAYAVGAELLALQQKQGFSPVGRKIGFSNRTLWVRLGLDSVIWSYMYDNTVKYAANNQATVSLAGMVAPKIEPEIVFKLKTPITSGFEDAVTVLQAVEWIALGYEIVDCNYANWRFRAADMVADFGFHAAMVIGTSQPPGDLEQLAAKLAGVTVKLYKNGEVAAEGGGKNVLESPVLSLGNMAATIARQPEAAPLAPGEVITSGTLTEAQFIKPGEEWRVELSGLELPPLTVKFH